MTVMPRSGNDATLLSNNAMPLGAPLATTMPHSDDDTNLGDNAMPLGAHSVTTAVHNRHYVDREGSHAHNLVCTLTNTLYTIL